MRVKLLLIALLTIALLVTVSCSEASDESSVVYEVKLSQDIIDAQIAECQTSTGWRIGPAIINVNYRESMGVEGAIVLHNGTDMDMLVTLYYSSPKGPVLSEETGITYNPLPIEASGWVELDKSLIRLESKQTEVVKIHFLAPEGSGLDSGSSWEFDVVADARFVNKLKQDFTFEVNELGDTTVTIKLNQPLLQDSIISVDNVESSVNEMLYASSYDPSDRSLGVKGFKELGERNITVYYESGSMVTIAYPQKWLIKML